MSDPTGAKSETLEARLEKWATHMVHLQQGKRTGSLRRQEAIDLECLLRDAAEALASRAAAPQELNGLIAFYAAAVRPDATIDGHAVADDYRRFFQRTLDVLQRAAGEGTQP